MGNKVIVVLSGGQDSTTCLFWAKQRGDEIHAITFDYNQRHRLEVEAAQKVAGMAGVDRDKHELVCLSSLGGGSLLHGTSPLVSGEKLEQYKDHASLPGGLEKTFVPMRNQLFLTIAANRALVLGAKEIITGVCEEDFGGYPDCRRVFIDALEEAIIKGSFIEPSLNDLIRISTPLMHRTKKASVELALTLPGCYEALAWTHTAYDGSYPPIGHDHATLLRAKGFEEAGIPDPLVLRAFDNCQMGLPYSSNYKFPLMGLTYAGWLNRAGL